MTPPRPLPTLPAALALLARLVPPSRRELLRGMAAELDALPDAAERRRFAVGAAWAVLRLAAAAWMPAAGRWLACLGAGALVAALDTHQSGACALAPLAGAAALLAGGAAPRAPLRGAAAVLAGLAAAAAWGAPAGFLDRTDLLSLLPLVVAAAHAGSAARRLASPAPRVGANA